MKIKLKEINEELDLEVECDSIYSISTIKNLFDFVWIYNSFGAW